jgi:hypothetical protein
MSNSYALLLGFGLPTCMLLIGSFLVFARDKSVASILQLLGATFLTVVVLVHVAETFSLLPWMDWGLRRSSGHYLDLGSAVLGLTLFPIGYLWHAVACLIVERRDRPTV